MDQLGGLAKDHIKFEEKGTQIIALAVQEQSEAALSVENSKAQFPILADSEHAVADKYGVYNGFSDSEATPSVFIISQDGRIVWHSVALRDRDRVQSTTILENLPTEPEEPPRTGAVAPDFTLPDSNGNMVHLVDELQDNQRVVLVFYHSHG